MVSFWLLPSVPSPCSLPHLTIRVLDRDGAAWGDWEEAGPLSQRDEIAASVNDWNRDKFFPTVGVVDSPTGPLVRATYLMDLGAGVSDTDGWQATSQLYEENEAEGEEKKCQCRWGDITKDVLRRS